MLTRTRALYVEVDGRTWLSAWLRAAKFTSPMGIPKPVELRVLSSLSVMSWKSLLDAIPPCSTPLELLMGPMTAF